MPRITPKKKEDIGLSPFALVFRGQRKSDTVKLRLFDFNKEEVAEFDLQSINQLPQYRDSSSTSWLNIDGLHDAELMEKLATTLQLENNVLSDVMNPSIRPKVQELEKGIFITIKIMQHQPEYDLVSIENLSMIIANNLLITFQEEKGDVFNPVRERIRKHKNKIRTSGADYLAFAILDIVIDNYIYVIGQLGEKIETLEETMTNDPSKELLDKINLYKREMNFLRKNIKPAKEMILNLIKIESEFIHDENKSHFKELQENITEASELSDSYREILYDLLNVYHTTISTKLNDIMRVLTIFSVIFIPLTFIAGIYGTNFDNIPELHWHYGYYIMWGVMGLISIGMLFYFKRRKWF